MKKILFSLFIVMLLVFCGLFGLKTMAARGTGSICTTTGSAGDPVNDKDWFPYRFVCGGDSKAVPGDVFLTGSPLGGTDTSPQEIADGRTINFSGGYNADGPPKGANGSPSSEVFVWATIDVNDELLSSSNITVTGNPAGSGSGVKDECPGTGSGKYAAVLNHRNPRSDGTYGNDASPAAYVPPPTNIGKEDCQREGKMVYWKNANTESTNEYGFSIRLNPGKEGRICVRLNLSVRFSDSDPYFHPDISTWSDINRDHQSVASHVVQQSRFQCYLTKVPPPPDRNIKCDIYTRRNLVAGSIYRFTVFPMDKNYRINASSPLNLSSTSPNRGGWANYNETPDYQTTGVLNTGRDFDDSHITYRTNPDGTNYMNMSFPDPSGPDRKVYIEYWTRFVNSAGNDVWQYHGAQDAYNVEQNCYTATCNITVNGAGVPGNSTGVLAGEDFTASITITNSGQSMLPGQIANASSVPKYLGITGTGQWPDPPNRQLMQANSYINPGQSVTKLITFTAPSVAGNYALTGYPDYYELFSLYGTRGPGGSQYGDDCGSSANVQVYSSFKILAKANISADSFEDPTLITYSTNGRLVSGSAHTSTATSWLKKGATTVQAQPDVSHAYGTAFDGPYTFNPTSVSGGDYYCAYISINPGNALIAPDGSLVNPTPATDDDCFTVVNRPFVSVKGNSVRTGGNFKSSGSCSSSEGLLASWNNNNGQSAAFPYNFGAGTMFSALANKQITGFASAQTFPQRSPTELTFANSISADKSKNNYSPKLGGNFGAGEICLYEEAPNGATPLAADNIDASGATASYERTGNLTIRAGDLDPGISRTFYVSGDVYIDGPIRYKNWTNINEVPSFKVVAKGNIYISPAATQLDGLFIANGPSPAGKIFTCGLATFRPMDETNLHTQCNNQLVVHGSFSARQINLMRTYGSIRDEKYNKGADEISSVGGARDALSWRTTDKTFTTSSNGDKCANLREPNDDNFPKNSHICRSSGDGVTKLFYTNYSDFSSKPSDVNNCRGFNALGSDYDAFSSWSDNYLCSNFPIHFRIGDGTASTNTDTNTSQYCTKLSIREEDKDEIDDLWKSAFVCIKRGTGGSPPGAPTKPGTYTCSRFGGNVAGQKSCAAELFEFSPELYLSKTKPDDPINKTEVFDVITSLPPGV